jgi:hypothetical protein
MPKTFYSYFEDNNLIGKDSLDIIKFLLDNRHIKWSSWILARVLENNNRINYSIDLIELAIPYYEKNMLGVTEPIEILNYSKELLEQKNKDAALIEASYLRNLTRNSIELEDILLKEFFARRNVSVSLNCYNILQAILYNSFAICDRASYMIDNDYNLQLNINYNCIKSTDSSISALLDITDHSRIRNVIEKNMCNLENI